MVEICKDAITQSEVQQLRDWFRGKNGSLPPEDRGYSKVKCYKPGDADFPDVILGILSKILDYEFVFDEEIHCMESLDFRVRLHVDNNADIDRWGHTVLIPLEVEGVCETVFFDNYWPYAESQYFTRQIPDVFSCPVLDIDGNWVLVKDIRKFLPLTSNDIVEADGKKFRNDETFQKWIISRSDKNWKRDTTSAYEKITNYDPDSKFDLALRDKYLKHVPLEDLHGLTLGKIVEWKIGEIYKIDRTELHCGGSNHVRKLGLTIFINRKYPKSST